VIRPTRGSRFQDLNLPAASIESRFTTRRSVLEAVNAHFAEREQSDNIAAMDTFYQRAYSLISSQKAREAFNIAAEPAKIRDEYGRNAAGQRMLMARRLIAAGVRFVTVDYGGWDMHTQIVAGMNGQMPPFDQAFAALIRDLDRTGLLNRTVVMVSSEFGRTPQDQQRWRPRPLAQGIQRRPGRRRLQARVDLRSLEFHRQRARARPDRPEDLARRSIACSESSPTKN